MKVNFSNWPTCSSWILEEVGDSATWFHSVSNVKTRSPTVTFTWVLPSPSHEDLTTHWLAQSGITWKPIVAQLKIFSSSKRSIWSSSNIFVKSGAPGFCKSVARRSFPLCTICWGSGLASGDPATRCNHTGRTLPLQLYFHFFPSINQDRAFFENQIFLRHMVHLQSPYYEKDIDLWKSIACSVKLWSWGQNRGPPGVIGQSLTKICNSWSTSMLKHFESKC